MQATVFDFTFRLREREREAYLVRGTQIVMTQDFRMIKAGRHPKNFSMRSALGSPGSTQEIANTSFEEQGSPYIEAMSLGDGLFSLSEKEGFSYAPKVLLRKSFYHGVIIGRINSKIGFLTVDRQVLLRSSIFRRVLIPVVSIKKADIFKQNLFGIESETNIRRGRLSPFTPLRIEGRGQIVGLSTSVFNRLIENRNAPIVRYSEKISFPNGKFGNFSLNITVPQSDFNGIKISPFLHFTKSSSVVHFNGVRYKYAIISLEKSILNLKAIRSSPSRFIIKG